MPKGLEGVVVDTTSISKVISEKSSLIYRGYPVSELAEKCTYEEVVYLLWNGELPTKEELKNFKNQEIQSRKIDDSILKLLSRIPSAHPMNALRSAVSLKGCEHTWDQGTQDIRNQGMKLVSCMPLYVASYYRLKKGKEVIPPRSDLCLAENFLYMCFGEKPDETTARAFEQSLILYADHGFNASTFATRVIASTTSDIYSAICGGIGALKGPLHGGANEQVIYMMKEIGDVSCVSDYLTKALSEKKKIMGFGHRVYKKGDSRVPSMLNCLKKMTELKKETRWLEMYDAVASFMKEKKNILPNVDFPAGPAYYLMGIDIPFYTPIFAMSRVAGWTAHVIEQKENNRIIRPMSEYIGASERHL